MCRFLNDAVRVLWPAFDRVLCQCALPARTSRKQRQHGPSACRLIKSELEPHMQGNMPSFVNGIHFERLSLGAVPFSILGVRHNPSLNSDHLGIGER